jgi:hypothetical protein
MRRAASWADSPAIFAALYSFSISFSTWSASPMCFLVPRVYGGAHSLVTFNGMHIFLCRHPDICHGVRGYCGWGWMLRRQVTCVFMEFYLLGMMVGLALGIATIVIGTR